MLEEGFASVAKTGEQLDSPWLHRVKGELLLVQNPSDVAKAERCFRTAIEIARRQSARSAELRATTSLARLLDEAGSSRRSAHDARRNLRLVHRGLRHRRPERRQGAARRTERVSASVWARRTRIVRRARFCPDAYLTIITPGRMMRRQVGVERKLTAILCADVYGYSRLMGGDEEATLRTLSAHRKIIDSLIEQHHGRFVNSAGDSVLAEFASVVEAVNCAVDIQTALKAENAKLPPERRMEFRIGVNLGDVMVEGDQIYGDGVNVAARLESLAEPGGICISGTVHEQIRSKLALGYEDLGEQTVKNIADPVHVWRVLLDGTARAPGNTADSTQVLAGRRAVVDRAGDHRRDNRAGTASVAQAAAHSRLDSAAGEARAAACRAFPRSRCCRLQTGAGIPQQEYFSDGID